MALVEPQLWRDGVVDRVGTGSALVLGRFPSRRSVIYDILN